MDDLQRLALKRIRQDAATRGEYFLDGHFVVKLPIVFSTGETEPPARPEEIVRDAIAAVALRGLNDFYYEVSDEAASYLIRDGEVVRVTGPTSEPPPPDGPSYVSPEVRALIGDDLWDAIGQAEEHNKEFARRGIYFVEPGEVSVTPIYEGDADDRMITPATVVQEFQMCALGWGLKSFTYTVRDEFTEYLMDAGGQKVVSTRDISYLL